MTLKVISFTICPRFPINNQGYRYNTRERLIFTFVFISNPRLKLGCVCCRRRKYREELSPCKQFSPTSKDAIVNNRSHYNMYSNMWLTNLHTNGWYCIRYRPIQCLFRNINSLDTYDSYTALCHREYIVLSTNIKGEYVLQ